MIRKTQNIKMTKNIQLPKCFFKMEVAGVRIEVECKNAWAFSNCVPYFSQFEEPDFTVALDGELQHEGQNKLRSFLHAHSVDELMDLSNLEALAVFYMITSRLLHYDVLLMHGSVVALDGCAYMFTAPSGVGKSTRTEIWVKKYPESYVVNGDKPFIKIESDRILACGSPWCGKEGWNTNAMVPLSAIFLVERSEDNEKDVIKEIGFREAFTTLLQQTFRPYESDEIRKTIQLLKAFENKVRFFRFRSAPTAEAIQLAYETVRGKLG